MPLTIQDILDRSNALILETQENSITPPRVGELTYALAELILQGSLGGNVIGASKLKDLEDVMLLGEQDNDILQLIGGKWKNTNLDLTKLQAMAGYFNLDDDDNLFTTYNLYSTKEIAALGAGTGEGGGGTGFSRLDEWSLYTNDKSGWVLSALLGKDLHDRVLVLEAGGGIATEIDPTVEPHIKNITSGDIANWATAYAKSHEHKNISVLNATTASFLTADRTKLDGIAAGANNYTHPATHAPSIIAQDTNNRFVTDANIATWNSKLATSIFTAHAANQTTDVKHLTDAQLSSLIALASYWKLDNDDNLYTEKNVYSTGEVSAFGAGSGGSTGGGLIQTVYGYSSLGGVFNNTTLTDTFNAYTINSLHSRINSLEAGSALSFTTIGTGNAVTSIAKSGNVVTVTKGLTFSVDAHTHNFSEIGITGLTTNYLTKFNGSTLVNSQIFDNGTNVGISGGIILDSPTNKSILGKTATNWYYILKWEDNDFLIQDYYNTNFIKASYGSPKNLTILDNLVVQQNGNVGIGTTDPTATLDVNGAGKFKDDILMTFNTWSHATDKNSLNKFLKLFDIDTAGNLVVKTNLYSTGEVTGYSSGTGISGLTLMADMNANEKNIYNLTSISKSDAKITMEHDSISFSIWGNDMLSIYDDGVYFNAGIEAGYIYATGSVNAPQFNFGLWSLKEVNGNMVISYNGTAKATIQSSRTNSNL